eukprot:14846122-Alexandrium_andersonii.AAC.1
MDSRRLLPMTKWRRGRLAIWGGGWPAVGQGAARRLNPGAREALGVWAEQRAAGPAASPAPESGGDSPGVAPP